MQAHHGKRSRSQNSTQILGPLSEHPNERQFNLQTPKQHRNTIQPKQSDELTSILGALNHELLDDYQLELFRLLKNATKQNIISYFQNHSHILYKFLITLYIASLDKWNPLRTAKHAQIHSDFQNAFKQQSPLPSNDEPNVYNPTFKEPKIESQSIPQPPMAFGTVVQPPMAFMDNSSSNNNIGSGRLSPNRPNNVLTVNSSDNMRKSSFAKQMRKIRKIKKSLPNLNNSPRDEKEETLFVDSAEIIAPMTRVCGKIRITTKVCSDIMLL